MKKMISRRPTVSAAPASKFTLAVILAVACCPAQEDTLSPLQRPPKGPAPRVVDITKMWTAAPADAATKQKLEAQLKAEFASVTDKSQQNCMQPMQKCGNEACGD